MTHARSLAEPAAELEALRTRLAETEEVLYAIRNGEVDALLVSGERGAQVYTLTGADRIYRSLVEAMSEGALTLSADGVIGYANQTFARLLQRPLEYVMGTQLRAFVSPADQPLLADLIEAALRGSSRGTVSIRAADGASVPLRLGLGPLQLEAETLICVVATDLTEEKKNEAQLRRLYVDLERRVEERTADLAASRLAALNMMEDAVDARQVAERGNQDLQLEVAERTRAEGALRRANRALQALSVCNATLIHAENELDLLQDLCKLMVETVGFPFTWIGYVEHDAEKSVRPVAHFGVEAGYIKALQITWADSERGQGPTGRAVRSGRPELTRDIGTDPLYAPWRERALESGFASNIALPLIQNGEVFGTFGIYAAEPNAFDDDEVKLLAELADDLAFGIVTLRTRAERDRIAYAHAHHAEILQKSLEQSIQAIADTVEARDPYTGGHQRRVGELAVAIARELGLPNDKIHGIHLAAVIHDLGKIRVPAEILAKPGKLTDIEFMHLKTHPQAGYDILKGVDFPWPIADVVRQHHERLDGSGYPQGLKGAEILLESRIMAVADVMEAMSSHRPYRPAVGIEAALAEIERGRGSAYDPAAADACLKLFREGRFAFQK